MKPSQVIKAGANLLAIKRPFMLWGAPGVGKSSIASTIAEIVGGGFIDMRLPLYDAVDLRGIPCVIKGQTVWMTPDMFPKDGKGVIFLDEIVQAHASVQSAASQLILDRRIGDYVLPDGWVVCAAGNREGDRASVNRMPSHIANRFVHLNLDVDASDWLEWAYDNDINPMVQAFIGFKTELLHAFDPKEKAFPSPRSWEFASEILECDMDDCLAEVIEGTVGHAASIEFMAFIRVFRELPDYESIVADPATTILPKGAGAKYAVSAMLTQRTQHKDMKPVMQYVNRLDKEFQILATQEMTRRNKKLAESSSYIKWAAENKDALLGTTV